MQKKFILQHKMAILAPKSPDSGVIVGCDSLLRELFTADIQRIEGVGAIGTVFEEVFLRLGKFLSGLIFMEAVAPINYSSRLDGEEKIIVILSVEERHESLLARECLVN